MLTGQRPFKGRDMASVRVAALTEQTPRVRQIDPAVAASLDAVVARAMARDPKDRYGSAVELAAALQSEQDLLAEASTLSWRALWPTSLRGRRARRFAVWSAAAVVLAIFSYAVFRRAGLAPSAPGSAVVAVLPLVNTTGDPANDYIGVGIADLLISALAQVPGVTMVSRSSSLTYQKHERDVASIARELGADLVVDGALQASRGTVRVTLSLLQPRSNRVAWSRAYDGALADIFVVQNEAAAALSDALRVTLTVADRTRLHRPPTSTRSPITPRPAEVRCPQPLEPGRTRLRP